MTTAVQRTLVDARPGIFTGVWQYRELLRSLIVRNLKVKYQRSVLGFIWTLLNPLIVASVLIAVFSYIVRIPLQDYWAFLLSGYFVWNFFQQLLSAGTSVLQEHARLRRSVAFPTEMLIFGATLSRFIEFAIELLLALVILVIFHHGTIPPAFALLPILFVLQTLIAVGLVMIIATLSVFYWDIQHMVPIALLMLFYLSPVFYPLRFVPDEIRQLYLLNPIAGLLSLYHSVLYRGTLPSLSFLGLITAAALSIALIGYVIFNRYKSLFAEIL
ncbi:MAG TPA: ABC transporter permease [Gemmatimonadaceae bacterium]|nr:ABC transporter permease [Gemmatimonadaceae bacterium]